MKQSCNAEMFLSGRNKEFFFLPSTNVAALLIPHSESELLWDRLDHLLRNVVAVQTACSKCCIVSDVTGFKFEL